MSVIYQINRKLLQPQFDLDTNTVLANSPFKWIVTWGFRTLEEQAKLHDIYLHGGPLAAPPGESAHNFGLAIDVVLIDKAGHWNYNTFSLGWIWLFAKILNHPRLHSGKGFGDADHIERYKWYLHKVA